MNRYNVGQFPRSRNLDYSILKLNKDTREGVNSLAHCFHTDGDTPSGPQALLSSRLESTLKTFDSVKNIFDTNMFLYSSISGTADDTPVLLLEAYSKYLLNLQAIPLGLVAFTPSCR